MEFSGTFELEDATADDVWLALSDPAMVQHALKGCEFLVRVDDEDPDFDALREAHLDESPELTSDPSVIEDRAFEEGAIYAALVEANVGSVSASFESVGTVDERDEPRMAASGEGSAGNSSFEMSSWMELSDVEDGVAVEWAAEADVFGRLAQMGQRMLNPVANRMTKQFFENLQEQIATLQGADADSSAEGTGGETPTAAGSGDVAASPDAGATDGDRGAIGGILARLKRLIGIG